MTSHTEFLAGATSYASVDAAYAAAKETTDDVYQPCSLLLLDAYCALCYTYPYCSPTKGPHAMITATAVFAAAMSGLIIGFLWGCHYTVTALEESRAYDREYTIDSRTGCLACGFRRKEPTP